jgi:hypothetical protein
MIKNFNLDFLKKKLTKSTINYKSILLHKDNFYNQDEADVSIILGVRERTNLLLKCLDYINYAKAQTKLKVNVTVVQHDNISSARLHSIEKKASYIFLPIKNFNTEDLFSQSLCFNVGFLSNKNAKYYIFHDCDLLLPHDFLKIFENSYFNNQPKWLQGYFGKSFFLINRQESKKILNLNGVANLYRVEHCIKGLPVAVGGSIIVSKDIFEQVGGYDPELFYGWSQSSEFFWIKLLCTQKEIGVTSTCHQYEKEINFVYPNNPPLMLYHLFHDHDDNPRWGYMHELYQSFLQFPYAEKIDYIETKRKLFKL